MANSIARNTGGRIPWIIPGIGVGASLIQHNHLVQIAGFSTSLDGLNKRINVRNFLAKICDITQGTDESHRRKP